MTSSSHYVQAGLTSNLNHDTFPKFSESVNSVNLYDSILSILKASQKKYLCLLLHRGSYMSAHVLMNLFNQLGKRDKM